MHQRHARPPTAPTHPPSPHDHTPPDHTTRPHHPTTPPDNTTRPHKPPHTSLDSSNASRSRSQAPACVRLRACVRVCARARACVRACVRVYISRLWLHRSTPTRSTEGPRSSIPPASPNSLTLMMRWSNTCIDTSTALSSRHSAPTSPHQSTATRSPLSVRRASTTPSATPRISRMRHPP